MIVDIHKAILMEVWVQKMTNEDAIKIIQGISHWKYWHNDTLEAFILAIKALEERPQGEFSRKDLESWLYQIAMNNIGTDFEKSVVEIINRLDGFERFVSEQKSGADNDV